jgi:DNA polymerase-3 subunit delta
MVAIRPSDLPRFTKQDCLSKKLILVFGPDEGGVRMRAGQIIAAYNGLYGGSLERIDFDSDALNASPGRLMDEAQAFSMFSSGRLILVTGAGKLSKSIWANALETTTHETPVLFLADELAKGSAIRTAFEQAENAAAIACYPASRGEVQALIQERVKAAHLNITAAASAALSDLVGSDLALTDRELEKLILYCDGQVAIEVDDVATMLIDSSELGPAEAIDRAFEGQLEQVEAMAIRCFADGVAPSGLIALALNHAFMLRRLAVAENQIDAAFRAERIFYKRQDRIRSQQRLWTIDHLVRAIETLAQAQLQMRKTPAIEETIAIRALWSIALASRRR